MNLARRRHGSGQHGECERDLNADEDFREPALRARRRRVLALLFQSRRHLRLGESQGRPQAGRQRRSDRDRHRHHDPSHVDGEIGEHCDLTRYAGRHRGPEKIRATRR